MRSRWLVVLSLALFAASAWAQIVAVPPAVNRGAATSEGTSTLLAPAGAPRFSIDLDEPSAAEQAQVQNRAAPAGSGMAAKRHARAVGFSRRLPNGDRSLTLATLPWQSLADGGKAAQIVVRSPGAAALRLGLRTASKRSAFSVRFADTASHVFGPYAAAT